MSRFAGMIERVPMAPLLVAAVLLALMPFGQPHLVEKLRMLFTGTLRRPLDWFDLVMHAAPLILVGVRLWFTIGKH
ncbi:MAG: hypothetical protein ACYC7A_09270 [Thermoanaerobaculia bacterium]